jgi:hypothetical protein
MYRRRKGSSVDPREFDPSVILAEGFDAALVGVADTYTETGQNLRAVYDTAKVLDILQKRDGMTYSEAVDVLEFQLVPKYSGAKSPVFMSKLK